MSPDELISAPTGAYCCSSARSVSSRRGSLLSPGVFPEVRDTEPTAIAGGTYFSTVERCGPPPSSLR